LKGSSPSFLDTNILIYAFSDDRRQAIARNLVETGGVISVQCLNEFVNVCRGRLRLSWPVIEQYVSSIRELCPDVQAIDVETHSEAVRIARQFGLHVYDATIVASALRSGCEILFTEDMHDGLFIDGRLRVKNPFRNV
jgi:predicted nucleic acid-binding protein